MIAFIRLITGEDLVGEIISDSYPENLVIKEPFKILYYADKNELGKISMGFMHWVFPGITDEQLFTIDYEQILVKKTVSEVIKDRYHDHLESYNDAMAEMKEEAEEKYDDKPKEKDSDKLQALQNLVDSQIKAITVPKKGGPTVH